MNNNIEIQTYSEINNYLYDIDGEFNEYLRKNLDNILKKSSHEINNKNYSKDVLVGFHALAKEILNKKRQDIQKISNEFEEYKSLSDMEIKELNKTNEDLNDKNTKFMKDNKIFKYENKVLKEEKRKSDEERDKLKSELSEITEMKKTTEEENIKLNLKIKEFEDSEKEINKQLSIKEKQINKFKDENYNLFETTKKLSNTIDKISHHNNKINDEKNILEVKIKQVLTEKEESDREKQVLINKHKQLETEQEEKIKTIKLNFKNYFNNELEKTKTHYKQKISKSEEENQKLNELLIKTEEENKQLNYLLSKTEEEKKQLNNKLYETENKYKSEIEKLKTEKETDYNNNDIFLKGGGLISESYKETLDKQFILETEKLLKDIQPIINNPELKKQLDKSIEQLLYQCKGGELKILKIENDDNKKEIKQPNEKICTSTDYMVDLLVDGNKLDNNTIIRTLKYNTVKKERNKIIKSDPKLLKLQIKYKDTDTNNNLITIKEENNNENDDLNEENDELNDNLIDESTSDDNYINIENIMNKKDNKDTNNNIFNKPRTPCFKASDRGAVVCPDQEVNNIIKIRQLKEVDEQPKNKEMNQKKIINEGGKKKMKIFDEMTTITEQDIDENDKKTINKIYNKKYIRKYRKIKKNNKK